jgi:hypothetical protein
MRRDHAGFLICPIDQNRISVYDWRERGKDDSVVFLFLVHVEDNGVLWLMASSEGVFFWPQQTRLEDDDEQASIGKPAAGKLHPRRLCLI